jgi:ankyrin repeat protein
MRQAAILITLLTVQFSTALFSAEIHDSAKKGDLEGVRAALARDPALAHEQTETGATPLHFACASESTDVVELLISKGAEVDAMNDSHYTPLHFAAAYDRPEIIKLLLGHGAQIEARSLEAETPLHMAAYSGAVKAARLLIDRSADLHAREARQRTALLLAARESGDVALAKLLIARGAEIDAVDESQDGALELAAWRGYSDFVNLLLKKSINIPTAEDKRLSLLNHATKRRLDKLLRALMDAGLELKKVKQSHPALILSAASGGSKKIMDMLIKNGFDPNYRDENGWTPLHCAAEFARDDAIRYLLARGARINARTTMGQGAYHIALEEGNEETAALLASAGADTGAPRFPRLSGEYLGQERPRERPVPFAPGIVGGHHGLHTSVAFAPDGNSAFWSVMIPPRESGSGSGRMLGTALKDGAWSYPTPPVFEGGDVPFFSPDGARLYFISRKSLSGDGRRGKANIWFVERRDSGWTDPVPADPTLNSVPMHWQFSLDRNGNFYIGSGDGRILVAQRENGRYQRPVDFRELYQNDTVKGGSPFISPDGDYLLFGREDDLFITFRRPDGSWTDAQDLGETINSPAPDLCPIVSPDGDLLFFLTMREGVNDVYWVAIRKRIDELRRQAVR